MKMSADNVKACVKCGKKAAHSHVFYIVRVDQAMVDVRAAQRQMGLEAMVGGSAEVAAALGDRDVINRWPYGEGEAQVCADCFLHVDLMDLMGAMEHD